VFVFGLSIVKVFVLFSEDSMLTFLIHIKILTKNLLKIKQKL